MYASGHFTLPACSVYGTTACSTIAGCRTHHQPASGPRRGPAVVGRRVRALREERGSLSTLARLAGVGKATLSGLEHGTRNPTLETLWAVTAQLGVPFTALLAEPTAGPTAHGTAVTATLLEVFTDTDATYELYRMRVAPGPVQLSPPTSRGHRAHHRLRRSAAGRAGRRAADRPGRWASSLGVGRATQLRGAG
ncbi:helix-turn-helix transcriptional regulator [Micromonospora sp. M12]